MSIARHVAQPIAQSIARSLSGAASGGGGFDPNSNAAILQNFKPFAYAGSTVGGLPVLESSVGTLAQPRGQRCYLGDGTGYIAIASLTGSETVVSKQGTATVSIATGRINIGVGTVWEIVLSNGSTYYCNEESGDKSYDSSGNNREGTITSATLLSWHSTSTSVTRNYANERGYTLSGSTVIPRNEADPTQDAAGGSLGVVGPVQLPATMEVPCLTGNGSDVYVNCSSALIPPTEDFDITFWYYQTTSGSFQGIIATADSNATGRLHVVQNPANTLGLSLPAGGSAVIETANTFTLNDWNLCRVRRTGTTFGITLNDGAEATATDATSILQVNTHLLEVVGMFRSTGRIAGLLITANGTTKCPLFDQCGPGSSNTNRSFYIVGSDGSATLITDGVVNGTIASIYANRCPYVRDWCIENGGGIAANGSFIPGLIGSANDAAGNAKTLPAGEHRNPFSDFKPNYWSAPSLVNIGSTSSDAYSPSEMAGVQAESTADTRYGSEKAYLGYGSVQTGSDKTNSEAYVL